LLPIHGVRQNHSRRLSGTKRIALDQGTSDPIFAIHFESIPELLDAMIRYDFALFHNRIHASLSLAVCHDARHRRKLVPLQYDEAEVPGDAIFLTG
jgi:hypothetical protein